MNPLAGKPLRYLIGADAGDLALEGRAGEIVVVPYDVTRAPLHGIGVKYCNLFDEENSGQLGPYREDTDTAELYGEGVIDHEGPGWRKNLAQQLARATAGPFALIELDNGEAYPVPAVLGAIASASEAGLGVLAKNPGLMEGDATSIVAQRNVYGIIVEKGAGTAGEMQALRVAAGKPDLPVRFVGWNDPKGDQRAWCESIKAEIEAAGYRDMSVTYSDARDANGRALEYGNSHDILPPVAPASPQPSAAQRSAMPQPTTLAGKIAAAMERKGYRVDRGPGEINIVYVRGMDTSGARNDNAPNIFNDLRACLTFDGATPRLVKVWEATLEPGTKYVRNRINPKGAAFIIDGQYSAWQVGSHRGHHEALIQTGGPVTVSRDDNEDQRQEGDELDAGHFGINQHGGYNADRDDVGGASAGCLVVPGMDQQAEFMRIVKSDPRYLANRQFVFTSTVLSAADVLADGPLAAPAVVRSSEDQRRRMGAAILSYEARRDSQGRLAVYALPASDGGGTYEVAGINDRYHPQQAAKLRDLIERGRYDDAEREAVAYILAYTEGAATWYRPGDPGVEFFLRDCIFNRGPSGAGKIFQRALGFPRIDEDGLVGPKTKGRAEPVPAGELLEDLRAARESYERDPVGYRAEFWNGLVNRWNKALAMARTLSAEAATAQPKPPLEPDDIFPPAGEPAPQPATPDNAWMLVILLLIMSTKEKPMADQTGTPPGNDIVRLLLPYLLESVLTGKPLNTQDLMPLLLRGLLGVAPAGQQALPSPAQGAAGQARTTEQLLQDILLQQLAPKTEPAKEEPSRETTPAPTPALQRPSVMGGVIGLVASVASMYFGRGIIPPVIGESLVAASAGTAAIGATGFFEKVGKGISDFLAYRRAAK